MNEFGSERSDILIMKKVKDKQWKDKDFQLRKESNRSEKKEITSTYE